MCSPELGRKGLCTKGKLNEPMPGSESFHAGLVSLGIVVTGPLRVQDPYVVKDTVGFSSMILLGHGLWEQALCTQYYTQLGLVSRWELM